MAFLQRIIVIGSTGSGKSTLARIIAEIIQMPVYHLDMLYWRPGWTRPPAVEWEELQQEVIGREEWVIEGMYTHSLHMRLAACDTIIFLDFPRWLTMYRVIKRGLQYAGRTRPDVTEGCPEKLTWEYIKFVWNFPKNKRPIVIHKIRMFPEKYLITLTSPRDVKALIDSTRAARHSPIGRRP